jgi:hypothetical protein
MVEITHVDWRRLGEIEFIMMRIGSACTPVHSSLTLFRGFDTVRLTLEDHLPACSVVYRISKSFVSYNLMSSSYGIHLTPMHKHVAGYTAEA